MSRFKWTQESIDKLKLFYEEGKTSKEIASELNTTIDSVKHKARSLKLKKNMAKIHNLLTDDEKEYIRNNSAKKDAKQIAKELNRNKDTVRKYIVEEQLVTRHTLFKHLIVQEDFKKDFYNPSLSHAYVGRKYNVRDWTIRKWRLKEIGNYKQMTDTFLCKSVPEIKVEEVLEDLDLAYMYEKQIMNWKVDYYLGNKTIIEVQGEYWHSLEKVKEKDERKFTELKDNGYTIIEIWENEVNDIELIKTKILNQMGLPKK